MIAKMCQRFARRRVNGHEGKGDTQIEKERERQTKREIDRQIER